MIPNRRVIKKTILFSAVIATLLVVPSFSVFAQEQAQAPSYKNGDHWQYDFGRTGKKWTSRFDTGQRRTPRKGGTKNVTRSAESEVKAIEDVTTPAGTFKGFKIERTDTQSKLGIGRGSNVYSELIYYSPRNTKCGEYDYQGPAGGTRQAQLLKYGSQS